MPHDDHGWHPLEPVPGLRIHIHPSKGRCVVATTTFHKGDIVVCETPTVVSKKLLDPNCLLAVTALPVQDRCRILHMHHGQNVSGCTADSEPPPTSGDANINPDPSATPDPGVLRHVNTNHDLTLCQTNSPADANCSARTLPARSSGAVGDPHMQRAEALALQTLQEHPDLVAEGWDLSVLTKVALCWGYNAHSFVKDSVALFPQGSKINHSCAPNTWYQADEATGHGVWRALGTILPGMECTASYLDCSSAEGHGLWSATARRRALWQMKRFHCDCPACTQGWDVGRRLPCPLCNPNHYANPPHSPNPTTSTNVDPGPSSLYLRCDLRLLTAGDPLPWSCPTCGMRFPDVDTEMFTACLLQDPEFQGAQDRMEQWLEAEVVQAKAKARHVTASPIVDRVLDSLHTRVSRCLGPWHWATNQMHYELAMYHTTALAAAEEEAAIATRLRSIDHHEAAVWGWLQALQLDLPQPATTYTNTNLPTNPLPPPPPPAGQAAGSSSLDHMANTHWLQASTQLIVLHGVVAAELLKLLSSPWWLLSNHIYSSALSIVDRCLARCTPGAQSPEHIAELGAMAKWCQALKHAQLVAPTPAQVAQSSLQVCIKRACDEAQQKGKAFRVQASLGCCRFFCCSLDAAEGHLPALERSLTAIGDGLGWLLVSVGCENGLVSLALAATAAPDPAECLTPAPLPFGDGGVGAFSCRDWVKWVATATGVDLVLSGDKGVHCCLGAGQVSRTPISPHAPGPSPGSSPPSTPINLSTFPTPTTPSTPTSPCLDSTAVTQLQIRALSAGWGYLVHCGLASPEEDEWDGGLLLLDDTWWD
uniref:SET domain-containing protein n=1 Tax=Eutreptiella gymnastica TaxID=73025 RepID=A0A7S1I7P8_9EUGL